MAITNRYSGFTQFEGGVTDRDSDFGENLNRDIRGYNTGDTTVTNSYTDRFNNKFGSSSFYSTNEQRVAQSMITESININGITVRYMPRMSEYSDDLWNERPEAVFDRGTQMDVYLESTSGFEGEGDVMTQYGIEFQEEVMLRLSIPRFDDLYSAYEEGLSEEDKNNYHRNRPLEGDLIVVPFGRSSDNRNQYLPKVFEIVKVTTFRDGAFFQLGDNYQYKLRCRLFELSGEKLEYKPKVQKVDLDGTVEEVVVKDNRVLDSELPTVPNTEVIDIIRDSELLKDNWADNKVIEIESQEQEAYKDGKVLEEKQKVMIDDYTSAAFGYSTIMTDLDDI